MYSVHTGKRGLPQQMQPAQAVPPKPKGGFGGGSFAMPQYEAKGPGMWDKIAMASAMLRDYDGTLGSGNYQQAKGEFDQRQQQQRSDFDAKQQQALMEAAAAGDPRAMFMLSPQLAVSQQNRGEDIVREDARYADTRNDRTQDVDWRNRTYQDTRADRADDVGFRDMAFDHTVNTDLRDYNAAQANARLSSQKPVALGEGMYAVWDTEAKTWDIQGSGENTFDADTFYMPPGSAAQNGFIQAHFQTTGFGDQMGGQGSAGASGSPDTPPISPQEYQKYRASTLAKSDSKVMEDARSRSNSIATTLMPQLDTLDAMINEGMPMGPYGDAAAAVGTYVPALQGSLGVPTGEEIGRRDVFKQQATKMVLDVAEQAKGSMSDSDREWFKTTAPQLVQTKTGAKMVIEATRALAKRDQEFSEASEMWNSARGGLSIPDENGETFYQAWQKYAAENPVVPSGAAPTSGAGPGPGTPASENIPTITDPSQLNQLQDGQRWRAPDGSIRIYKAPKTGAW